MIVYEGIEAVREPLEASSVAIGVFDGVHLGHQAIIGEAVRDARANGRQSLVVTFDRHPEELVAPEKSAPYLTTPAQRNALIASLGVDGMVIARFNAALVALSPEEFVVDVLKARLGARAIVVGRGFCFGKGRAGDVRWLDRHQTEFGYTLRALDSVIVGGSVASSTRIRDLLQAGDVTQAEEVLGHAYWLVGRVVAGQKLGRALGYPTANLDLTYRQVAPADGIYAAAARLADGRMLGGACAIGNRPTIPGAGRCVEVHLLDFEGDLYGQELQVRFLGRLRAEERFDSLDLLKRQMDIDVETAREIVARHREDGDALRSVQ